MNSSTRHFIIKILVPVLLVLCILMSLPLVCGDHGHSHEEPASFKWSKEANEPYWEGEEEHHHEGDLHGHHGHAHTHEGHGHGHGHSHEGHGHSHDVPKQGSNSQELPKVKSSVWMEALVSTFLISIAPYLILFCIPITSSKDSEPFLKILLAFASGGLLGDAFLHLIPHALMAQSSGGEGHSHSHSHSHSHNGGDHGHDTTIGQSVLGGIILFFIVEKFVIIFKGGHTHSHSHGVPADENKEEKDSKKDKKTSKDKDSKTAEASAENSGSEIRVAAYLNLAADFTHNLTDGLAIGASFLAGKSVGIVTTLTIFLHEIPHEIGDFAILLQSGYTRSKAMQLQLVTAAGAFTGTLISLMAEGSDDAAIAWILPFTAGGFIYIATVSVIPELLKNSNFKQSFVEVIALLSGVGLMMGIATLEEMGHDV